MYNSLYKYIWPSIISNFFFIQWTRFIGFAMRQTVGHLMTFLDVLCLNVVKGAPNDMSAAWRRQFKLQGVAKQTHPVIGGLGNGQKSMRSVLEFVKRSVTRKFWHPPARHSFNLLPRRTPAGSSSMASSMTPLRWLMPAHKDHRLGPRRRVPGKMRKGQGTEKGKRKGKQIR